jgi:hypothetical protein
LAKPLVEKNLSDPLRGSFIIDIIHCPVSYSKTRYKLKWRYRNVYKVYEVRYAQRIPFKMKYWLSGVETFYRSKHEKNVAGHLIHYVFRFGEPILH